MKNLILIVASVSVTLVLDACGNKSTDDVKRQVSNTVAANGEAIGNKASYASICSSTKSPLAGLDIAGGKTVFDLSNLEFSKKHVYYSDECKTEVIVIEETGKVHIGDKSSAVPGAYNYDFNFEHTHLTFMTDLAIKAANLINECGFKDWAIGVFKDVSSQAKAATCFGEPSPRVAHELALIEGGSLYLGNNAEGEDSKARPTQVDRSQPYLKQ